MNDSDRVRIYDLSRSLVPDHLSEREKRSEQTRKTKQILAICERLGYTGKTASSSLDKALVAQILSRLDSGTDSQQAETSSPKESTPPKKSRVLRRIVPKQTPEEAKPAGHSQETDHPESVEEEAEQQQQPEGLDEEYAEEATSSEESSEPSSTATSSSQEAATQPESKPQETKASRDATDKKPPDKRTDTSRPKEQPKRDQQPFRVARPAAPSFGAARRSKPTASRKSGRRPQGRSGQPQRSAPQKAPERPASITLTRQVTVKELAELLQVADTDIIRRLFLKGVMRTVTQDLDLDLAKQVAEELGVEVKTEERESEGLKQEKKAEREALLEGGNRASEDMVPRSPVVTIMGHVDHGKTTLLDAIRQAKKQITSQESGGITQHIGAYQVDAVDYDGAKRTITFLDTPGHEAFTALRSRGARVTDLAILVVSADDGVMPQTIEAISHAKAAGIPLVVAVNKIDKPGAKPETVLSQLVEQEVVVEDFGGNVACAQISAKEHLNLDDLLAKVTLVADAELIDKLTANPDAPAVGDVIESELSPHRGPIATLLVQNGTLRKGDSLVAGLASGRVRAMFDDNGRPLQEAGPATPVQILGLDAPPQTGDTFQVMSNLQRAKEQADQNRDRARDRRQQSSLEAFSSQVRAGSGKELPLIVKADVQGSAEAIAGELRKLSTDKVGVRIMHCAAGGVTETDLNLASATGAIIINFNSALDGTLSRMAEDRGVSVYTFSIIYQVTETIRQAMTGMLEPERVETDHGEAQVKAVFPLGKSKIAGCTVMEGKILNGTMARIYRGKEELASVAIRNLKRYKDTVREVSQGYECGISFEGFDNLKEGDRIRCFSVSYEQPSLS